jgi:hypothetical protein
VVPASVPGLVAWCKEFPGDAKGFPLPPDTTTHSATLVDRASGKPTEFCLEWATYRGDSRTSRKREEVLRTLSDLSRSQDSYLTAREFLVERQVLTELQFHKELKLTRKLEPFVGFLKQNYVEEPAQKRTGRIVLCRHCSSPLARLLDDGFQCEVDICRRNRATRLGLEFPADLPVRVLEGAVRRAVVEPDLVTKELVRLLSGHPGVGIRQWPRCGEYDIEVTFAEDEVWGVLVHDWATPRLLGERLSVPPHSANINRVICAVPADRFERWDNYVKIFSKYAPAEVRARVELRSFDRLRSEVRAHA